MEEQWKELFLNLVKYWIKRFYEALVVQIGSQHRFNAFLAQRNFDC